MVFVLNDKALLATEKAVGINREAMIQAPLCGSDDMSAKKHTYRQIMSRGSVYLQHGRKVSIEKFKKIINKF